MARAVRWDLIADPKRYKQGFREAESVTKKFNSQISRVGGTIAKAGSLFAGAFAGVAVIGGIKSSIDAASNLNETISKSNVIFGKSAKEVAQWSKGSARSFGLSRNEALSAAASFGDMFQQLKLGQRPAVTMSKSMVQLAADFASFHNADITQVLEAQSAAFRGEYDSLQRFIPNISAARVEQVALAQSHKTVAKELTAAEKAQAVYTIMLKDGKRAVGDFARTSGGAANQQRILKAQFEDLKATVGRALLPVFTSLVKLINNEFIPAIEKWWKEHAPKVKEAFKRIRDIIGEVVDKVNLDLLPALRDLNSFYQEELQGTIEDITAAWKDNKNAIFGLKVESKDTGSAFKTLTAFLGNIMGKQVQRITILVGLAARAFRLWWSLGGQAVRLLADLVFAAGIRILQAFQGVINSIPGGKNSGWGKALSRGIDQLTGFRRQFNAQMDALKDESVTVTAKGVWVPPKGMGSIHGIVGAAGGGPISGPGTSTSDSIPAMLSTGEHVLSAREVTGLGGHRAVEAMRRSARGFAAGGAVTPHMRLPSADGFAGAIGASIGRLAAAIDRLTIKVPIEAANIPHAPGAWKLATAFLSSVGVPYNVISTFRPGARTHASGRQSYHALNRAVDLTGPNMLAIWQALTRTNPTELIYSRAPYYKSSRGWRPIGALDPITRADHFSHVHAAYKRGGRIPEDVVGVGRSGRTYGFHGGETVTPKGGITLRIESGGSRMDNLLVEVLREAVRARGGNVQTVLGRG